MSVYNNISLDISNMCGKFVLRSEERSMKRKPSSTKIQLIPDIDSGFEPFEQKQNKIKESMDTKTYQLNSNNHDLRSTQPMKVVTKSPDDVVKVQFGQTKSQPTSSVVQNVGTRVNQDVVVVPTNQQSDPKTIELIQKIKMIVNSMNLDEKQLVHWRKRKFESALKVGENLVTIRIMFGKDKSGFRKMVETEFINEFCYKTAERYMKLFTNKKDLPPDVCSLRKAFISLGLMKEEDLDIEKKPEDVPVTNPPVIPSTPTTSIPKVKDFVSVKKKKLYDHPNSILVGHYRLNTPSGLFQVVVNPDGILYGIDVEDDSRMGPAKSEFEDIVFERLKPFVEWYNVKNKEKEEKKKEIDFYSSTVDELDRAA